MSYFYLISCLFFMSSASIFGTFYNRKNAARKAPAPLYNLTYCIAVLLSWVILFLTEPIFEPRVLLYSLGFGISYAVCEIGFINALRTGSTMLTNLLLQLALIATTIWGFFFWDVAFSILTGIGLVLVVIALWCCLYNGKSAEPAKKISLKWLIFSFMSFAGNAGCAIIQKTQQVHFNGKYGSQLMMCAVAVAVLFSLTVYLKNDKRDSKVILKGSWGFPIAAAVCNVLLNLFIIFLASSEISPSLIYPVIAVGGIAVTSLFSVVVFRERLRAIQWIGMAIGTLAVVLLSV